MSSACYQVVRCSREGCRTRSHELIAEEPLLIRIEGKPYSVVMRTPGQEISHAAGFCLGEGIADSPDDFLAIGYCQDLDPNVIDIRLKPDRVAKIRDLLERRGFVSQTSCGLCGKEMVKDLHQALTPVENDLRIEIRRVFDCIDQLSEKQKYYQRTRGSHAALIVDQQLEMIAFAEDVGRHNALDKAVGQAFISRQLPRSAILVLSSRISFELVQKAARARLPIMISMSRPTALAVEMGRTLNLTLACVDRGSEMMIASGEKRIVGCSHDGI